MLRRAAGFSNDQLRTDGARDPARNLVLQIEQIGDLAVESVSPEVGATFRVDELRVYANLVA
jgi:hypothetical protein